MNVGFLFPFLSCASQFPVTNIYTRPFLVKFTHFPHRGFPSMTFYRTVTPRRVSSFL